MASASGWPIEATSLGGVTCGTLAFKTAGRIHVTVVAKATFAFVRDRAMVPVEPEPIAVTDQHLDQNAARSLLAASDLAPYRPAADMTLHGHAVAFQGRPARSFQVRMMIAREGRTILEKLLFVRGPRDRSSASPDPVPFLKMPLVYELAARRIDPGDNPAGIAERPGSTANIVDPRRPGLPAGFGPIPEHWTARRATLGTTVDPRILRTSLPAFPEGFPSAGIRPDSSSSHGEATCLPAPRKGLPRGPTLPRLRARPINGHALNPRPAKSSGDRSENV